MAEGWRFAVDHQLDIGQILLEAKNRWLRPSEICEILRNYKNFTLTPDPPYKPSSGSLFLYDRKVLRYFRKDGHSWRKKKDGKTVREAHEKLKCGSIDVLHCYYAHGEDNENFQRRSYWMLDGHLEHIVLVHYRDVNEGSSSSMPHLLNSNTHNAQHSSAQTVSSELEGADSGDDYSGLLVDSVSNLTTMFFSSRNIVNRKNVDRNGAIKYCRIEQAIDQFLLKAGALSEFDTA